MLSLLMTAAGLILAALSFLVKCAHDIRNEAIEATKERAKLQSQIELMLYRLDRIERQLYKPIGDSL
ncbi:hypothetical protein [Calothrix sp. NIES-2098]|uniref:hypothetical protein n=1 Tax=Calothrix sp. NIES-2098 TaxID=1954171 RepID=UPI000B60AA79|nr:hypothetical protein NIES2098_34730 [Calothrix sp. NIES-2098]